MPSRPDRVRVWRGEIKRTKGGLTKDDLMKNKSGKIVSRRRSAAAKGNSNLGDWLRTKGQKFTDKPKSVQAQKKAVPVPKKKPAPKKPAPKPKPAPKKAAPKPKPAPKKAAPKKREVISLLDDDDELAAPVRQPAVKAKRDKVSVSNIRTGKRVRRKPEYAPLDDDDFDYGF